MPASAVSLYESLRSAVLHGHARPDGLGAIIYHGLVHGLSLLSQAPAEPATPLSSLPNVRTDRALLHLLANMVLRTHEGMTHVY